LQRWQKQASHTATRRTNVLKKEKRKRKKLSANLCNKILMLSASREAKNGIQKNCLVFFPFSRYLQFHPSLQNSPFADFKSTLYRPADPR
jgi:hypothetical protein